MGGDTVSEATTDASRSPSPLANKFKFSGNRHGEIRESVPAGPEPFRLPSEHSESEDDIENSETEDDDDIENFSQTTYDTRDSEDSDDSATESESDEGDYDGAVPLAARDTQVSQSRTPSDALSFASSTAGSLTRTRASKARVSNLAKGIQDLSIQGESDSDLSAYILPSKNSGNLKADLQDGSTAVKKKKRCVLKTGRCE